MRSPETVNVAGYQDRVVPCALFRQEHETGHLGVLFPGFGYSGQMPLLYYPRQVLFASGADVFVVGYNYSEDPDFVAASGEQRKLRLQGDAVAAYEKAAGQRKYERVTLVGKSIGTRAVGHVLATEENLPALSCIWLTPIFRSDTLCAQMKQRPHRGLFVVGTSDAHYLPDKLAEVQEATAGQAVIIEGANHSLEIPGNVGQSLQALERIMVAIGQFLG